MAVLPNFTLTKHNMTEYIQKYGVLQTLHFSISDRSIFFMAHQIQSLELTNKQKICID